MLAKDVIWNLSDLYIGPDDPEIESDMVRCRNAAGHFSKIYSGRLSKLTSGDFFSALMQLEKIEELCQKIFSFIYLCFSVQAKDLNVIRQWRRANEFKSHIEKETLFFSLEWTRLSTKQSDALMQHSALRSYRHYLSRLRKFKSHRLSKPEERILAAKRPAGSIAWETLFDKIISCLCFGSRNRMQAEVLGDLYSPDRQVRKDAADELTSGLKQVVHILTYIYNTIILDKEVEDKLRKYPQWYSERNLENEINDELVDSLVKAVKSRYDIVHHYYFLKRKILGYKKLYDYDRYAPFFDLPSNLFTWEAAKKIVIKAYHDFSPQFAQIASLFFNHKWIHAQVLQGKISGAFSHPTVPSCHPYILVNFTGTMRDLMVLGHELGHGIHQYLSRKQGIFNNKIPMIMAEIASVFGEMLVFYSLLQRAENPSEKLALICSKLENSFTTIFRQTAIHCFEDKLHRQRRAVGELGSEDISDIWMATQKEMYGESLHLLDHYSLWWSYIPHLIHYPGYVYAYAFAELIAFSMFKRYREEKSVFLPLYTLLLESGANDYPENLLKPFDIDFTRPDFFYRGFTVLEELLDEAAQYAEKFSRNKS